MASANETTSQNVDDEESRELSVKSTNEVLVGNDDNLGVNNEKPLQPTGNVQGRFPMSSATENAEVNVGNGATVETNAQLISANYAATTTTLPRVAGSDNNKMLPTGQEVVTIASASPKNMSQILSQNGSIESEFNQSRLSESPGDKNAIQYNASSDTMVSSNYSSSKNASDITKQQIRGATASTVTGAYITTKNGTSVRSAENNSSTNSSSESTGDLNKEESAANSTNNTERTSDADSNDAYIQSANGTNSSSNNNDTDAEEDADATMESSTIDGDLAASDYKYEEEVPDYNELDANGQPVNFNPQVLVGYINFTV